MMEHRFLLTLLLVTLQNQGVVLLISLRCVIFLMFVFQILSRQFISYTVGFITLAHDNAELIARLALPLPHPVLWELGVAPRVFSTSLLVCVCGCHLDSHSLCCLSSLPPCISVPSTLVSSPLLTMSVLNL